MMKRQETSGNLVQIPSSVPHSPLLLDLNGLAQKTAVAARKKLTVEERKRLWEQRQQTTTASRDDVVNAGKIDMSTVYKIPVLILSVNAVKNKSPQSQTNNMVQALVLPLRDCIDVDQDSVHYDEERDSHYLCIRKDTWNAEQRNLLKEGKAKDNEEEYNIDDVVGHEVTGTPDKRYVYKRIYESSVITFNDQSKVVNIGALDYTVANMNPLIWYKKYEDATTGIITRTLSQMFIGKSYEKVVKVPPTQLYSWIHDGDRWTHRFFTTYPKWDEYERQQGENLDSKSAEAKKVIYSNDTFVLLMGMRNEEGMNPRFMSQREAGDCMLTWEVPDNDPELFKRKSMQNSESPMLTMQYLLQQWDRGPRESPEFINGKDLSAVVSMIAMEDTLNAFYIPKVDAWLSIIPQIASRIPAVVFGVENRMRTSKSQITMENRPEGVGASNIDMAARIDMANRPRQDGHASFELNLFSKNIVFDMPRFLLTTGVPVTPETVKKVYGGNLVRPQTSKCAYGAFTLQQIVNEEVIPVDSLKPNTDISEILKDNLLVPKDKSFNDAQKDGSGHGKYSLRMLVSYEPHEPTEELWDHVSQMTPEQGDEFFNYLNAGVFNRKGKQYLESNDAKFPKGSPARAGWTAKSTRSAYYMFYIVNTGVIAENIRSASGEASLTIDADNTMPLRIADAAASQQQQQAQEVAAAAANGAQPKEQQQPKQGDSGGPRKRSQSDGGKPTEHRDKRQRT